LNGSAYAQAGVDIDAGVRAVEQMADAVRSTYGPEVLAGIGAFGGLYDAAGLKTMESPVLVASTDSVGTKTRVAARLGRWDTIGHDLVNHCVNDVLVQGARPLFFLDYVASAHIDPEHIARVVGGVAAACREAGCALLGGETAELPGVYQPGEIDLVGTVVGIVERDDVVDGSRICPGDVLLGLRSVGLHTNGYSLARRVLDGLNWDKPVPELGCSIGEALLIPHRSYQGAVGHLRAAGVDIKGLAHITGGGVVENLPRILPVGTATLLRRGSWPEPPIFGTIQRLGGVDDGEMFRVFNMGLGMLAVVPPEHVESARAAVPGDAYVLGEILTGDGRVTIEPS
jgi:phosphoribosylformylglycinamidine cyclo-ligase